MTRLVRESRTLTGQTMTDHDMAMSLFLQNTVDIAAEDEDEELARLLAYDLNIWEDDTHTPGDIDLETVLQ